MNLLQRFFGGHDARAALQPLYAAVVVRARDPRWYAAGGVPDTVDGRFDMVAAILALVLIRLESAGEAARGPSARLTELFVDDMDGQLREQGVGDVVVGKHVGRMMSALGGRLAAYRAALAGPGDPAALESALIRNLYRGAPPAPAALADTAAGFTALHRALADTPGDAVLAGRLPA